LFSGNLPFHEQKIDSAVLLSLLQRRRPARPSDELSKWRGLGDEVWTIVETCWAHDPTNRPTARQAVELLQSLPNRCVDRRPLDTFSTNILPQSLFEHTHHPLSALAIASSSLPAARSGSDMPSLAQNQHILNRRTEEADARGRDNKWGGEVREGPSAMGNVESDDEVVISPAWYVFV
jgi:hypothetical protein